MNEEFVKFCIVGGTGIIVNNILLWVFVDIIKIPLYIAGNLAIFFSILYVFILNDIWTFANMTKKRYVFLRLAKFYISKVFRWVVNNNTVSTICYEGAIYHSKYFRNLCSIYNKTYHPVKWF